jgi:molybdenum cofactor synthesis domain-containing protein
MPQTVNPTAAIMIIGDEILSGRTLDTNVNTIAKFLASLGIDLNEVRMVRDVEGQIIDALNSLRRDYDYVFTTGGIGPTHDDITADAVAKAFGVEIVDNPEARQLLEARAKSLGAELNANSLRMARIPVGARLIKNPISAAPGIHIGNVFVMAGVPKIMASMLDDVAPYLKTGRKVLSKTLKLSFIGESWAADVLRELDGAYHNLSFGSYPYGLYNGGEFGTNLVVRGIDEAELNTAFEALKVKLGPVVEVAQQKNPQAALTDISEH